MRPDVAVIVGAERVFLVRRLGLPGAFGSLEDRELIAFDLESFLPVFRIPLRQRFDRMSPVLDQNGVLYLIANNSLLRAVDSDGNTVFELGLPIASLGEEPIALGLYPRGVLTLAAQGRVIGVQTNASIAATPWPRHRRDNLSTGHR